MKNYQPITIRDQGLRQYLESTRDRHNNKGFDDFSEMVDRGIFKTQIARMFGVTKNTIWDWLKYYQKDTDA